MCRAFVCVCVLPLLQQFLVFHIFSSLWRDLQSSWLLCNYTGFSQDDFVKWESKVLAARIRQVRNPGFSLDEFVLRDPWILTWRIRPARALYSYTVATMIGGLTKKTHAKLYILHWLLLLSAQARPPHADMWSIVSFRSHQPTLFKSCF